MTSLNRKPCYDQFDYTACMEKNYSNTDYDVYYEDFHLAMRRSELTRTRHMMRSPQLDIRVKLIEFARTLCTERLLARTTLHLSCYIMDRFLDLFEVAEERLRMFSAVCVLIAAKLEDRNECIPRWSELQSLFEKRIETREYAILECMIINALQWKVNLPTAASFLEYYIVASITIHDIPIRLRISRPQSSNKPNSQMYPGLRLQMYNLVYYLLDLSLNEVSVIGMRPSKLASATILCARQILDYRPFWNIELQQLTGYEMHDLAELASELRNFYKAMDRPWGSLFSLGSKRSSPFALERNIDRAKRLREI